MTGTKKPSGDFSKYPLVNKFYILNELTTSEQSEISSTIDVEKEQKKTTLYKTEMCRNWEERGSCRYGSKCQFAHSETELRKVRDHPKYKTEICKTFWQNGTCPYGYRCCFIHNNKERIPKKSNSADNVKNSNKKEKSKGLSKYGSDPSLYGSYDHLSDSSNSSANTSIFNELELQSVICHLSDESDICHLSDGSSADETDDLNHLIPG